MKRRLFILGVLLLAGAIVNIAVALCCAMRIDSSQLEPVRISGESCDMWMWRQAGALVTVHPSHQQFALK